LIETNIKRKRPNAAKRAVPIVINQIYGRTEAAIAVGCATITLIRAHESGNLKGYRIGRNVRHSGQHLIDWLESGGKTGWHKPKGGVQ